MIVSLAEEGLGRLRKSSTFDVATVEPQTCGSGGTRLRGAEPLREASGRVKGTVPSVEQVRTMRDALRQKLGEVEQQLSAIGDRETYQQSNTALRGGLQRGAGHQRHMRGASRPAKVLDAAYVAAYGTPAGRTSYGAPAHVAQPGAQEVPTARCPVTDIRLSQPKGATAAGEGQHVYNTTQQGTT